MRVTVNQLQNFLVELFQKYGANLAEAREISSHLVMSNLRGNDSHGVMRAPWYIDKIEKKELIPGAPIQVENETASSAVVNGNWGFGQCIARFAMDLAIKKAREQVISCVTVKNCNHVGRIGAYTSMASAQGMIGIGTANLHGTSHVVAPFGGVDRKLPTNPISIACPSSYNPDFLLDMSSCMVSEGTLKMKYNTKEKLPEGWVIDYDGHSALDAKKFYEEPKGAILPLGGISGYKGFALSLAIDVLSGALSGAACSNPKSNRHGNACCFIVIRIDAFTGLDTFKENVGKLTDHVKSSRRAPGVAEISMPGEPELKKAKMLSEKGLVIDKVTWDGLRQKAEKTGMILGDFFV